MLQSSTRAGGGGQQVRLRAVPTAEPAGAGEQWRGRQLRVGGRFLPPPRRGGGHLRDRRSPRPCPHPVPRRYSRQREVTVYTCVVVYSLHSQESLSIFRWRHICIETNNHTMKHTKIAQKSRLQVAFCFMKAISQSTTALLGCCNTFQTTENQNKVASVRPFLKTPIC